MKKENIFLRIFESSQSSVVVQFGVESIEKMPPRKIQTLELQIVSESRLRNIRFSRFCFLSCFMIFSYWLESCTTPVGLTDEYSSESCSIWSCRCLHFCVLSFRHVKKAFWIERRKKV